MVASETGTLALLASSYSISAVRCRSPLPNKIQPSAMRCRVGRRPTSRSMALTSCQGQPVRSARPSGFASSFGDCDTTLDRTVGRDCIIRYAPTAFGRIAWAEYEIVAFAIISQAPRYLQLPRNSFHTIVRTLSPLNVPIPRLASLFQGSHPTIANVGIVRTPGTY